MSKINPRPCARCGILRGGRVDTLCEDCRLVISQEENALWKAQLKFDLDLIRRLAA